MDDEAKLGNLVRRYVGTIPNVLEGVCGRIVKWEGATYTNIQTAAYVGLRVE